MASNLQSPAQSDRSSRIGLESDRREDGNILERRGKLEFITFTDLSQTAAPETKRKIRSHTQRRVQEKLRKARGPEKDGEIILDISSLSNIEAAPSSHDARHDLWGEWPVNILGKCSNT